MSGKALLPAVWRVSAKIAGNWRLMNDLALQRCRSRCHHTSSFSKAPNTSSCHLAEAACPKCRRAGCTQLDEQCFFFCLCFCQSRYSRRGSSQGGGHGVRQAAPRGRGSPRRTSQGRRILGHGSGARTPIPPSGRGTSWS
jgi:hypothetical protein